ncbi:putative protein TPRXL [Parambassis ranga]|uniref:Mucin-5AC-like n=1 Tax=Parambassis ranga TaxID=210632 RepID=A0A6P7I0F4_9TELE|nr:putative protein TPRXL [Parambassis ranga]
MRTLLLAVILGLLAVVHSTPVDTVTQNPTKPEDDVFREAMTDGFLIDLPTLTTEPPKISMTTLASLPPSAEPKDMDDMEGSASGEPSTSIFFTATTASHSSTRDTPLLSPLPGFTSTSEAYPSETANPEEFSGDTQGSGSGFEDEPMLSTSPSSRVTSSFTTQTSTAPSTSTTAAAPSTSSDQIFEDKEGSASGSGPQVRMQFKGSVGQEMLEPGQVAELESANPTPGTPGDSTPGWILVIGFIAGAAALVMLSVAIATRNKWNRPNQASVRQEPQTDSSNQQRELEMETFLHKQEPRENGKAAEYTVIPLDELPEDYSSH